MDNSVKVYNVLGYEPGATESGLKVVRSVISNLVANANIRLADLLRPVLQAQNLAEDGAAPLECAAALGRMEPQAAASLGIPADQRFMINTEPYGADIKVPENLDEFAEMQGRMASDGIAVTFINTACSEAAPDFEKLSELIEGYGAVWDSTWILTTSLRQPIPKVFMEKIAQRKGGRPGGPAAKRLAVSEGLPCLVPIGESIVMTAQGEAVKVIQDRLVNIRRREGFTAL